MSTQFSSSYFNGSFHKTLAKLPKTEIPPPKTRMRCRMGSIRFTDILKIVLGIVFGYSLRIFTEQFKHKTDCEICPEWLSNPEVEIIRTTGDQQPLGEPFKPRTKFEVLRFDYFNGTQTFTNFEYDPKHKVFGHQKRDLKNIIAQTIALYNEGKKNTWKMKQMLNGYRRFDPIRGEEYFLDLEMASHNGKPGDSKVAPLIQRVRFQMVKPFGAAQMINNQVIDNSRMIHFILPISYDVDSSRLNSFLATFEIICLKTKEQVYLMVVLFTGKTDKEVGKAQKVKEKFHNLNLRYRLSHIRVIQTGKPFSRAMGLDLGTKQLPPEKLMLFIDIDMVWSRDFLERCRLNAVKGQQVYYPIVFAQYNPQMVLKYSPKEQIKSGLKDINQHTGHWNHHGFGMTCMYNADYISAGRFNLNNQAWGGEDVELFEKFLPRNISIFRATEPGLIHIYHNKTCSPNLSADKTRMCIGSMANGYASKSQLSLHLLMPK